MSLHETLLEYENEFKYDTTGPSSKIQQLLSGIKTMNAYQVLITEDTSMYVPYRGIKTSFSFISNKGKLYYHKDTKQVVLITSYDSDSNKKKVYQFRNTSQEDITDFHAFKERQQDVQSNPFFMRISAHAQISSYVVPIVAVLTMLMMVITQIPVMAILITFVVYSLLFLFILFIKHKYPM